jgi:hypothetical protein
MQFGDGGYSKPVMLITVRSMNLLALIWKKSKNDSLPSALSSDIKVEII